ncbi:hypothetical protein J2S44_002614 [Catenuloplanes niger]|uniref:Uncharacterized protein n=1 Tax=Catenuloplanes niger TaxID=587534 RepID=A0AAE4CV31_9ACTN|nr:hypothetical protein [Catenuloplanes niger]
MVPDDSPAARPGADNAVSGRRTDAVSNGGRDPPGPESGPPGPGGRSANVGPHPSGPAPATGSPAPGGDSANVGPNPPGPAPPPTGSSAPGRRAGPDPPGPAPAAAVGRPANVGPAPAGSGGTVAAVPVIPGGTVAAAPVAPGGTVAAAPVVPGGTVAGAPVIPGGIVTGESCDGVAERAAGPGPGSGSAGAGAPRSAAGPVRDGGAASPGAGGSVIDNPRSTIARCAIGCLDCSKPPRPRSPTPAPAPAPAPGRAAGRSAPAGSVPSPAAASRASGRRSGFSMSAPPAWRCLCCPEEVNRIPSMCRCHPATRGDGPECGAVDRMHAGPGGIRGCRRAGRRAAVSGAGWRPRGRRATGRTSAARG